MQPMLVSRKILAVGVAAAVLAAAALLSIRFAADFYSKRVFSSSEGFVTFPLPIKETDRLFDVGVVDANADGLLDIYTSNHHFRQVLLLADGKGGYRDVLSDWGLDQSQFPLAELTFTAPEPDRAGVYVYWLGTAVVVRTHRIEQIGAWRGSMRVFDPVEIVGRGGFEVHKREAKLGTVTETTIEFSAAADGKMVLRPDGQGLPLDFSFGGDIKPENIFVGLSKISAKALVFSLAMRDRHAHAWADFNGDGVIDVFINRGALSGTLRAYPPVVVAGIHDELRLSQAPGLFGERAVQVGIEKKGCSGRHAQWVDFDGDGMLDLFVNCYDREHFAGDYPKQLYRQGPKGMLRDVAEEVGLGLPDQQMGNLVWMDADQDGDADLIAFQDEGIVLYRQARGAFVRELVVERTPANGERIGRTSGSAWFYDGKFSVADFDGDGDMDVFSASRRGNVLLRNEGGRFVPADLRQLGLPLASMTGNWVDYDNDGLLDLHLLPQGLFRQRPGHTFEETGVLAVHPDRYQAAIVNWFDADNDGRLDILVALHENPDFSPWWEFGKEPKKLNRWDLIAMRNVDAVGHWLQVEVSKGEGNPQGIGATVSAFAGSATMVQAVGASEGSFFSQGHYRVYFGLGSIDRIESIKVRWPDGFEQEMQAVGVNRRITMERSGHLNPTARLNGN